MKVIKKPLGLLVNFTLIGITQIQINAPMCRLVIGLILRKDLSQAITAQRTRFYTLENQSFLSLDVGKTLPKSIISLFILITHVCSINTKHYSFPFLFINN